MTAAVVAAIIAGAVFSPALAVRAITDALRAELKAVKLEVAGNPWN